MKDPMNNHIMRNRLSVAATETSAIVFEYSKLISRSEDDVFDIAVRPIVIKTAMKNANVEYCSIEIYLNDLEPYAKRNFLDIEDNETRRQIARCWGFLMKIEEQHIVGKI